MKKLLTIGAAAAALLIPAASASAFPIRECGHPYHTSVYNVTARGLSCKEARGIASDYVRGVVANMFVKVRYNVGRNHGYADVRMTRYSYVVRFQMAQD